MYNKITSRPKIVQLTNLGKFFTQYEMQIGKTK